MLSIVILFTTWGLLWRILRPSGYKPREYCIHGIECTYPTILSCSDFANRFFTIIEAGNKLSFKDFDKESVRVQECKQLMWTYQPAGSMPGEKWRLMEKI